LNPGWLAPLTPLYAAGLAAKNSAFDRGWLKPHRLRWPVVSIGNLSVGGSGKTPLTILLAELLMANGVAPDVLSRGYGRDSMAAERVDPEGDALRFGDEPLLIARRAGVPVVVGGSRYEAGLLAEAGQASPTTAGNDFRIHLLDDGFQHRQLARDADIVVLHRSDFSETLLPAGRLREPLRALRRADFVVLREEDAELERELRQLDVGAPVWWMRRSVDLPQRIGQSPLEGGNVKRAVAFCGIARPAEFFSALTDIGILLAQTIAFPDHHRFTSADLERLARACAEAGADALITSEKDAIKLNQGSLRVLDEAAPVRVARLVVSLRDEETAIRQIKAKTIER